MPANRFLDTNILLYGYDLNAPSNPDLRPPQRTG